jgi:hypothetical protein
MTAPKITEKLIAYRKARIARLDARIKDLQAKRDSEESTLAELRTKHGKPNDFTKRTCNPPIGDGLGQPFQGFQQVVLEKRTPQGNLDFTPEQPPTGGMTFDAVWDLYARTNPKDWDGSWATLRAWLDSKGWIVRAKTW